MRVIRKAPVWDYLVCSLPAGMTGTVSEAEIKYGHIYGMFDSLARAEERLRVLAEEEVQALVELTDDEADRHLKEMVAHHYVECKSGQEAIRILCRPRYVDCKWRLMS